MSLFPFVPEVQTPDAFRRFGKAINYLLGRFPVPVALTAAHTMAEGEDIALCDATAAAFTVALPKAALFVGTAFTIKKIDASANAVTIDGDGAETIDGAATVALGAQWDVRTVYAYGGNWLLI